MPDRRPTRALESAVVGGGILGLALALRLTKAGHRVTLIESGPRLGGLTRSFDYGEFVWDEFYHCILPQDRALLSLIDEIGLTQDLRWQKTGTGYFGNGAVHPMSSSLDFVKFPLLGITQKARLAWSILRAKRIQDPASLAGMTAEEWLIKLGGKRTYEVFWLPLLRSKFGEFYQKVDANFMWATITRLFGAREKGDNTECLGYVRGGYGRILEQLEQHLRQLGVEVRTHATVERIAAETPLDGRERCALHVRNGRGKDQRTYDNVYFTAPAAAARQAVDPELLPVVDRYESRFPKSRDYLGVVCVNLVLRNPLTPYYVINIGGEDTGLTGVVEMTNLIDRNSETNGRSLIYLPKYLPAQSPEFADSDDAWIARLVDQGLRRLFPHVSTTDILSASVHRAPFVQALPLAVHPNATHPTTTPWSPLRVVNTAQLEFATLNNSAVLELANSISLDGQET